jgi:hypothetical protein
MKILIAYFFFALTFFSTIQAQSLSARLVKFGFNKKQVAKADVARSISYYTEEEKDLFMLINLVRLRPRYFSYHLDRFCKVFCLKEGKMVPSYDGADFYTELKEELLAIKPQAIFNPDLSLHNSARDHAVDCGINGFTGHVSSNGEKVVARVARYNKRYTYVGESCDYGYQYAPNILIHLLVDDEVITRGHRYALLDSGKYDYNLIGLSIQPHKVHRFNAVIDFTNTER